MQYSVILLAFCLGLAAALPSDKRGGKDGEILLPTEVEYDALYAVGEAMRHMAKIGWYSPQKLMKFIEDAGNLAEESGEEDDNAIAKRHKGGPDPFWEAIKEHGVYNALLGKVFADGVVLQYTKQSVEHAQALEGCKGDPTSCPKGPDFAKIIKEEIEAAVSEDKRSAKRELVKKLLDLLN